MDSKDEISGSNSESLLDEHVKRSFYRIAILYENISAIRSTKIHSPLFYHIKKSTNVDDII